MFSLGIPSRATGSPKYYFYHPENRVGTELMFNPLTLILNGGFDILRNGSRTKDLTRLEYRRGFRNVMANIAHPVLNIRTFGVEEFIAHELLPLRGNLNYMQYFPNYATHLLGNGMQYVKTAEWFDYHDYRYPHLLAMLTTTFYQVLNESVENGAYDRINVDAIADLLIFNPLGILLFSFESPKKFFSRTMPVYDWSLQPVFNPWNSTLENAGQQYALKFKLPYLKNLQGMVFWGIQAMAGLSWQLPSGSSLSLTTGVVVNTLDEKRFEKVRFLAPHLDGALAVFYDHRNALLASLIITGPRLPNLRLNIFPGFFGIRTITPGIYIGYGEWDRLLCGLTLSFSPLGIYRNIRK